MLISTLIEMYKEYFRVFSDLLLSSFVLRWERDIKLQISDGNIAMKRTRDGEFISR